MISIIFYFIPIILQAKACQLAFGTQFQDFYKQEASIHIWNFFHINWEQMKKHKLFGTGEAKTYPTHPLFIFSGYFPAFFITEKTRKINCNMPGWLIIYLIN